MSTKRIIDLQTASTLGSDDYVMIDSATSGTKKYAISELKTAIDGVEDGTGISDGAIGTDALDDGAVTNAKLASNSVGTSNLQNGSVTLAKIASGSEATTSASGLMSSTDKAKLDGFGAASTYALKTEIAGAYIYRGSVANEAALPVTGQKVGDVYNIIAASSYGQAGANVAWNGSDWDALGETFDIGNGTVTTGKIADLAVTEGKLANSAVTTNKIADANVTTAKIADSNVTTGKLANLGVTEGKIANNAVTSDKIASNAVITEKITDGAVTANKLDASAVTTAKINNLAVTTDKLASESVTSAKLGSNSVSNAKIVDQAVNEGKLAPGSVTTPKIADLAVTEDKLANAAVTTDKVADGAITRDKLNEEVTDELDFKADVDGYYTDMTVGAADNLTGRGDATTAEFLYRTAGGTADIETGQAVAKSIKGNTLVWNQKANASAASANNSTIVKTDTTVTCTGTATSTTYFGARLNPQGGAMASGHKMLFMACINRDSISKNCRVSVSIGPFGWTTVDGNTNTNAGYIASPSGDEYVKAIIVPSSTSSFYLNAEFDSSDSGTLEGQSFTIKNPQLFDLTQMFGAGNEPSTVAEFEALFPEPYYEYDAGSLLSVNMEGIETVGFNQLDPAKMAALAHVTESGGVFTGNSSDFLTGMVTGWEGIEFFPDMQYEASFKIEPATASGVNPRFTFVYTDGTSSDGTISNGTATTISTAGKTVDHLSFNYSNNGRVSLSNPCIHLVWSGRRNGEYEAFWKSQRLIDVATYFPDGMRSASLDVYDELTATEAIKRVGTFVVDGVNYKTNYTDPGSGDSSGITRYAINTPTDMASSGVRTRLKGAPYTWTGTTRAVSANQWKDGDAFFWKQNASTPCILFLCKSGFSSAAEFDAWLQANPQTFTYIATPVVTPIDPPLNLSYRVDDFGTERIMVPEDERSAPPVLDIAYGLNVVDFVRRAPSEYISHASFQQFCIALQTKLGIVITETWDDTDNRYEYSIADAPSSNEG